MDAAKMLPDASHSELLVRCNPASRIAPGQRLSLWAKFAVTVNKKWRLLHF